MSRRCRCPFCLDTVSEVVVYKEQNFCIKCYDEYCAVMARYQTRHANADGRQLELIPAAPATPLP